MVKLISLFLATSGALFSLVAKAQEVCFKTGYIGNLGYYYLPPGEKPREKLVRKSQAAVIYLHITQLSKAETVADGAITQKYIELLSENIREEPYGWLWTHKRWKR